jgi:hypothetical protein
MAIATMREPDYNYKLSEQRNTVRNLPYGFNKNKIVVKEKDASF